MRKIFVIIFFLSIPLALSAQWFGDGLSANTAYYGVINGANAMQPWNTSNYPAGVIYVGRLTTGQNDLEVGNGGTLTISSGITVKFCTIASDLRITGNGTLSATGTPSVPVLFTKNTQASWGHISFEASTGNSAITYCTIEYGLKNGIGIEGYGGGIHANTSNLVISHSTIQNNFAKWGGGIFVNKNQNPGINNCVIKNNTASSGGGGINFWNGSFSVVTNCLIYQNNVTSATIYGGGGVFVGPACGAVRLINCTLAGNSASFKASQTYFDSSPSARIVNSILWGTNTPYFSVTSSTFVNCAIQGGYPLGSIGCINLNSSNSDPTGPNFNAIDGSDWSIKYISPCRDAGTNAYAGIPATDYAGKPTIGTKDIGAYEVQYSKWSGAVSTIWSVPGNWMANVDPSTGTENIIIPAGLSSYPTGSSPDFTIKSGTQMIIEPGARVTLGNLVNNGALALQSDSSNLSSLIISSYSGNDASISLFLSGGLAGGLKTEKWHYISSPVTSLPVSTFAPAYTLNVAGWYDNRVSTTLSQGWVAYDGYIYSSGQMGGPTFPSLDPGRGYDYYDSTPDQYTFAGQFNTADVSMSLSYSVDDALHGFNLLGNPFSAGLNWDLIANDASYPLNTNKSISYTRDNTECTYVNGVGNPGDVTGIIPPMQGFFVRTHATGNTITLAASARTQSGAHLTYKSLEAIPDAKEISSSAKAIDVIPLIRLGFAEGTMSDETVVRFDNSASTNLDNDFDGIKMFISTTNTQIYSALAGVNYAINGQPFPADSSEIPVIVNLITNGDHNLSATQIQGLENYKLLIIDKTANTVTDLKSNPVVSFNSSAGKLTNRFSLKIVKTTGTNGSNGDPLPPPVDTTHVIGSDPPPVITEIKDPYNLQKSFNIYPSYDFINIQAVPDDWDGKIGSVTVLDLMGRPVSARQNVEFRRGDVIHIQRPKNNGMYIVEIRSGIKRFVGKVMIR